jgi:folate-dependent phosphoribosylglycinamide formyltransferase PurN
MRIVILTHNSERHYYFCNQLIEKTGQVVGIVTGGKQVYRSRKAEWQRRLRRKEVLSYVRKRVLNLCFRSYGKQFWQEKEAIESRFFGGAADHFAAHHRHLVLAQVDAAHRSINHRYYVECVRAVQPDVIAVMGTCMLGKRILALAPYVLNMHTGLSPYYRGGQSNMWPILEGDFGYFGVTVHKLSPGIDSGDIVYSQRPDVAEEDTYVDINCKCIVIGIDLMVQAIQQVEAGTMEAVVQWTSGKLFLERDMSHYTAYQYFKKRRAFMEQYCRLAREQQLPQVRLIS